MGQIDQAVDTSAISHLRAAVPNLAFATPVMPVQALARRDHPRLIDHFLSLSTEDRLLRFGNRVSDAIVRNYVQSIDFDADSVFGVFDDQLALLGIAHLARLRPYGAQRTAELGVSVLSSARGQGIGTQLFVRTVVHCRNSALTTLYMHCLAHNGTMMRIATRAGMSIKYAGGEADAYLALPPADSASRSLERYQTRTAASDYARKRRARHPKPGLCAIA